MATARRARILAVDDDASMRAFVDRVLQAAGYAVVIAADGRDALRIVEQTPNFELYVLDLMMPGPRGHEVAAELRRREPDAKILYFTGFSDRLFQSKPALWANEAFLDKPVTVAGLLEAVSLLIFQHTRGPDRGC